MTARSLQFYHIYEQIPDSLWCLSFNARYSISSKLSMCSTRNFLPSTSSLILWWWRHACQQLWSWDALKSCRIASSKNNLTEKQLKLLRTLSLISYSSSRERIAVTFGIIHPKSYQIFEGRFEQTPSIHCHDRPSKKLISWLCWISASTIFTQSNMGSFNSSSQVCSTCLIQCSEISSSHLMNAALRLMDSNPTTCYLGLDQTLNKAVYCNCAEGCDELHISSLIRVWLLIFT